MKTNKQTREIIEDVRLFHSRMSDYFDQLHRKDEKERLKILLDYLTQHEKHRDETLAKYEDETLSKSMDVWFKYIPMNGISKYLDKGRIESNMSVQDVVGIALDLDDKLIKMYKRLVDNSKNAEIRNMFNCLLSRLEQEKKNLVRDTLWLEDF
jgi:rubrerythrin